MISDKRMHTCYTNYVLNSEYTGILIYPFGINSKRLKDIISRYYRFDGEIISIDKSADADLRIENVNSLVDDSKKWLLIICSDNKEIYSEIRDQARKYWKGPILDIKDACMDDDDNVLLRAPMYIERISDEQRKILFDRVNAEWSKLGEEEAFWSVVTYEQFKKANLNDSVISEFYETGESNIKYIESTLRRLNIQMQFKSATCLELGCGTGRVTCSLAKVFNKVIGVDISAGNLRMAKKYASRENIEYRLIKTITDYAKIEKVDFIFTTIVLQHNMPPIIEYLLEVMMQSLKCGGVFMFQVPTYKAGYYFSMDECMSHEEGMEMHLIPQQLIYEIIDRNDCLLREAVMYDITGNNDESMMFVVQKKMY